MMCGLTIRGSNLERKKTGRPESSLEQITASTSSRYPIRGDGLHYYVMSPAPKIFFSPACPSLVLLSSILVSTTEYSVVR